MQSRDTRRNDQDKAKKHRENGQERAKTQNTPFFTPSIILLHFCRCEIEKSDNTQKNQSHYDTSKTIDTYEIDSLMSSFVAGRVII